MNYEKLLDMARERATRESRDMWPPSVARIQAQRELTVRYYLEYISPIVVPEAYQ
jgi:hypothetical protein